MNNTLKILGLSAPHLVVSVLLFYISFTRSMRRFDLGDAPTLLDRLGDTTVTVLWFPFLPLSRAIGLHGGNSWELFALAVNSLLWGMFLYIVIAMLRRRTVRIPLA